jgi:tRNA (mo5U34)-methyltransferase
MRAVEDVALWYHTLELPGAGLTPGWFDLRGCLDKLPWPDVRGKRCLDIGTYDGFYAFELERRGAAEVIATDIPDHEDWDWPAAARARSGKELATLVGEKGNGFEVARAALGSSVERRMISAYHLTPEELGTFDVIVCGSLLLHLRDPVRALESIRSVCRGSFMSIEEVSLPLSLAQSRRPVADMRFDENRCQWWVANTAGHQRMVQIAGFEVLAAIRPFSVAFGVAHPARRARGNSVSPRPDRQLRGLASSVSRRLLTGGFGVPHAALLARPRLQAPPVKL